MSNNDFYEPVHNGTAGWLEYGEENTEDDTCYGVREQRSYPDAYAAYTADLWFEEYYNERLAGDNPPLDWADEYHFGLPNRGKTKWAVGALRFSPGWDDKKQARILPDQVPSP